MDFVSWRASIVTLFPEAFPGTLGLSVIGRAHAQNIWSLDTHDLRAFGVGPHRNVDDTPAGGGAGMVMRADVAAAAIDSLLDRQHPAGAPAGSRRSDRPILYPSPRGEKLTQAMAREWAAGPGLIVFCGRFEGLDERVIEARGMREICVGDAVLAGGEAAALVILEATIRLLPGVLGNESSLAEESFEAGLLEHPQYTRPQTWEGRDIPAILTSGDHAKVEAWRQAERERLTAERRPDLKR
jgi:tRNA (guanine37-N1)-methyltransferase